MLKNWTSHAEYQHFIILNLSSSYPINSKRITELEPSISNLYCLNLDILREILKYYYSNTGRPTTFQHEIFRSFALMLFQREASITKWVNSLRADELLANCIGCTKDKTPSLGAHYDFISRLWLSDLLSERIKLKSLQPYNKKPSKTKAPGKNNKLTNNRSGIVKKVADFFYKGRSFNNLSEYLLQNIFAKVSIDPSFNLNLIGKDNLTVDGDGTCVHCHSSYYRSKVYNCRYDCKCPRNLSAVDTTWGWNSYENRWFYGHTLYAISSYNK
ncbi:hypothetical protein KPL40_19100 [Clostridium gasigenes]|uniref:hypothetical protein n=1 Tax=Clostridium gasigenes TaxID=94869 RepID=UPI001C0E2421|nr:hypothetical protein [Clostridium gasigenes]MBU3134524.1 hypothetical protein [Clostridium gasigenes]